MTVGEQAKHRPYAIFAVMSATVFTGVAIALQTPLLREFPGTAGDPIMRGLSFLLLFAIVASVFKVPEVLGVGPGLERRLGTNREVKLRHIFSREIRATAIWGGMLQAIYSLLFVLLVPYLAPAALASARACVMFALVAVELVVGILPRGNKTVYARLALSIATTAIGASLVIFANGFALFKGDAGVYMWVFVALIGPGNFILALAELAEFRGVKKANTAAAVYTFARFVAYTLTFAVSVLVWGAWHGNLEMVWHVAQMCWDRWFLFVPIALFWGLTDLIRICVKTVIPATYMYVLGSLAVAIDAVTQSVAKWLAPDIYPNVHGGWEVLAVGLVGGAIITAGAKIFPHPKAEPGDDVQLHPVT